MGLNKRESESLNDIYLRIYKQLKNDTINIFLCGGEKTNSRCIRDKVRDIIISKDNINVLYPEDMFLEKLAKDKNSDLLICEKFLADNSDLIFIICESPGALVELGAFVNNSNTFEKVIALIEEKHKKDKSFIMLGPIKYIRRYRKDNLIFYTVDNVEKVAKNIMKRIQVHRKNSINNFNDINTLAGLKEFIPLLLFFYANLNYARMKQLLEEIFVTQNFCVDELDTLINAALKLQFKERNIQKQDNNLYKLTFKGYEYINKKVYNSKNFIPYTLCDKIKFDIMYSKFYKNSSF